MENLVNNYDFEPARYGTTYERLIFTFPEEEIFLLTGAIILMQVRKSARGVSVAEFTTLNSKITILTDYSFCLEEQTINITADNYWYDILIIYQNGRRDIPLGGKWTILESITRKSHQ